MSMPVFCCNSYNAYRSLRDKFVWQNLQYLVTNKPLFWMEASSRWSEDIDGQHNWPAFSLSRLKYFIFFSTRHAFFSFDSNFKLWTRFFFFFFHSWTYVLLISTHTFYCIPCILQVSTYVLCFQHVFTIDIILSATERHTYHPLYCY